MRRGAAIAAVGLLAACSPATDLSRRFVLDCTGPVPGGQWIDSYGIDLDRRQYCENDCPHMRSIRSIDGSRMTIDLYDDPHHLIVIDLETGRFEGANRTGAAVWTRIAGHCDRVSRSRYRHYD